MLRHRGWVKLLLPDFVDYSQQKKLDCSSVSVVAEEVRLSTLHILVEALQRELRGRPHGPEGTVDMSNDQRRYMACQPFRE